MTPTEARAAIAQISSDLSDISAKMALLSSALAAAVDILATEKGQEIDTETGDHLSLS